MSESIPTPPPAPAPLSPPIRRRVSRRKLALGCVGGVLILLMLLAALAPLIAAGAGKSTIERKINESLRGTIAIDKLSLSWFSDQRIENAVLADPEGRPVARVSATLPSLWKLVRSKGTRIGRVRVELEADLVAGDDGITNLQRAIAPRGPAQPPKTDAPDTSGTSPLDGLAELDLDLELVAKRVTWSDAETRKLGRPFELSNLKLVASAKPGAPITVKADAQVAGETPGAFSIDARIHGPIQAGQAWPFGTIEARGDIRGFSSALVDGLAGQQGRLKELLGASFDLTFSARDVTSEKGEITAELVSPASHLKLAARLENGVVRAQGERLLDATIALPRAYLDAFVIPKLPPGSKLDFGAQAQPWSVRIDAFELALPTGAKMDLASLAPQLENATCHLFASLASPIGFENEQTRVAFGRPCSLEGTQLELSIAPKTAPSVKLTSSLVADGRSPISIEASSKDAWSALAKSQAPHVDAQVELADVSVAALDAFVGTAGGAQGKLAQGLGERLRVVITATDAGLDRGSIVASVKSPRLDLTAPLEVSGGSLTNAKQAPIQARLDAPAGWVDGWIAGKLPEGMELVTQAGVLELSIRELNVPLPAPTGPATAKGTSSDALRDLRKRTSASLRLKTPALRWSNPVLRAEHLSIALAAPAITASLAADGHARIELASSLDTGAPGQIALQASVADVWTALAPDGSFHVPPIDATLELSGVSPALLAALSGQGARVRDALGGALSVSVRATQLDLRNGGLSATIQAPRVQAQLDARLENGVLRSTKDAGLQLNVSPDAAFVQRELAAFLPPDTQLAFASQEGALAVTVVDLEVPLPDFASAQPMQPLALLEAARASVRASVKRVSYADASTRAAKTEVALEDLVLATQLVPKQSARVDIDAALVTNATGGASERGTLHADATISDPWFALREGSKPMPPVDLALKLANVPTRTLDAFAGAQDLVSKLLGPTLALDVSAKHASLDGGEISLTAKSPTTDLRFSGALANSTLVASSDQGLALSIRLPAGWLEQQISPKLPAGARLSLPTDVQPLTLSAKKLRIPLAPSTSENPPAGAPKSAAAPGARKNPPAPTSAESSSATPSALFERLAGLAAEIELAVPELTYADANTDAAAQPIVIHGLRASAALSPDALPFVKVNATVQSQTPGELAADLRALDPLRMLGEDKGLERFRVSCDVRAKGLPTALVDALAGQGGLLVEALGARVDVTVKSESLSMTTGNFAADMTSELHSVHCEGSMQERVLRIQKQDGLAARIGLGPVTNERVVGRLVPMLVNLQKPEGATPAILAVDSMNFPFDGGLRGLDADVRVDLGEVSCALLPGMEKMLGDLGGLTKMRVPALAIPIRKGVAAYKDVPFQLGGQTLRFNGSFDLSDLTLRLDTAIPLKALGKKFNKELDKVREYVSPDLSVPIEIRGHWKHPKFEVPSSFVGKLVEDAAKKGLGGLLDGLLKKKD